VLVTAAKNTPGRVGWPTTLHATPVIRRVQVAPLLDDVYTPPLVATTSVVVVALPADARSMTSPP
jgi:hypothetical protein